MSVSTASTTILASFPSAIFRSIVADPANTAIVYVKLGATAASTDFPLHPGAAINFGSGAIYTGVIDGIAASGTQKINVLEF